MKTIEEEALESANKAWGEIDDSTSDMDKEFHHYHIEAIKEGAIIAQRWISVEEKMPKKFKLVIVKCESINGNEYYIASYSFTEWDVYDNDLKYITPTHWRPIELK